MISLDIVNENKNHNLNLQQRPPQATIFDEAFIKIFAPFRFFQKIFGSCRVDIRDGIVFAPTLFQKCYTIVSAFTALFFAHRFMVSYTERFYKDPLINIFFMLGLDGMNIVILICVIHMRFLSNKGNVKLYIQMQKIDNVLKLISNDSICVRHYKQNLVVAPALPLIIFTLFALAVIVTKDQFGYFELFGFSFFLYIFVLELGCCISHMTFFTERVSLINSVLIAHLKSGIDGKNGSVETLSKRCIAGRFKANKASLDFESSETDACLKEIFCGFSCFKDQYQFQICFFCVGCAAYVSGAFLYGILALRTTAPKRILLLDFIYLCIIMNIFINILLLLCVRCQAFLQEVKKTKKLSITILSRHMDGPLRQKAKKMLKLIEDTPPCFAVYGMWCVNAHLLLDMFQIITSLWVTILQFAIL